ncbi:uncharacterized [Tachysurus ichikawai]
MPCRGHFIFKCSNQPCDLQGAFLQPGPWVRESDSRIGRLSVPYSAALDEAVGLLGKRCRNQEPIALPDQKLYALMSDCGLLSHYPVR